jgi:YesN/AraC family two-component response regulator
MEKETITWFARNSEALANYEVFIYQKDKLIVSLNYSDRSFSLLPFYFSQLYGKKGNSVCLLTPSHLAFGLVRDKSSDLSVAFGPALLAPVDEKTIAQIKSEIGKPELEDNKLESYLRTVKILLPRNIIAALNKTYVSINHDLKEVMDIIDLSDKNVDYIVGKTYGEKESNPASFDPGVVNYCKFFEDQQIAYVQNGEPDRMKDFLPASYNQRKIFMTADIFRTYKDRCIAMVAIISRAAMASGVDPVTAYYLQDNYMQKAENGCSAREIDQVAVDSMIDFCKRVQQAKTSYTNNPTINRAINYVNLHKSDRLTTSSVTAALKLPSNYISTYFKKATGENFTVYIAKVKIEEAKRILTYTDKSISQIAESLSFSSQSYFQFVFKDIAGISPLEYRKIHQRKTLEGKE